MTASVPEWSRENDGLIMLSDLHGNLIRRLPHRENTVNIEQVANGFYQLRSLNEKGISHRLGYIMVKRF